MHFAPTRIPGVWMVDTENKVDERGFFARTWCRKEFEAQGLNPALAQCSISYNAKRGTLRGMHYQVAPHTEAKLVRCTRGTIYDVALDLRPGSPTFKQWVSVELTSQNRRAVYIPEGVAHGFQTLEDSTEVLYQISESQDPACARGVRWDDPAFTIAWPPADRTLSARDRSYPDYTA